MNQPTNSFKVRPAFASLLLNLEKAREKGVISSSSGNFAQGLAYAGQVLNVDVEIVMTENTSPYKVEATKKRGATVTFCGPSFEERWKKTFEREKQTGRLLVHPYNSKETILGDSTLALEILEQNPEIDTIVVPSSGGGLLSGVAFAAKNLKPSIKLIGVQPIANGAIKASLEKGKPVTVDLKPSLADALVAASPGNLCFELIQKYVDQVVLVSEEEIVKALNKVYSEENLKPEPGAVVGIAAQMAGKITASKNTVHVLTGGNISGERFSELVRS